MGCGATASSDGFLSASAPSQLQFFAPREKAHEVARPEIEPVRYKAEVDVESADYGFPAARRVDDPPEAVGPVINLKE